MPPLSLTERLHSVDYCKHDKVRLFEARVTDKSGRNWRTIALTISELLNQLSPWYIEFTHLTIVSSVVPIGWAEGWIAEVYSMDEEVH